MATNQQKKQSPLTREQLSEEFLSFVETKNARPGSLYELAGYMGESKEALQSFYKNIAELEQELWKSFLEQTYNRLNAEPAYADYVARERLLAFYYTLLEVIKPYRTYIKLVPLSTSILHLGTDVLAGFKSHFKTYTQGIVNLGVETGEVEQRTFLVDKYHEALWAQCLFILNFWTKDTSEDFQKTDEAVERSVNLSLDLMARGPIDSLVEFGQFLFKNR